MRIITLVKEIVVNNPAKVIFIIIGCVSFYFAGTFPESIDNYRPIYQDTIKLGDVNKYIYISEGGSNGHSLDLHVYNSVREVKDGLIYEISYNGLNVALWTLFIISAIVVLVASSTDDGSWEIGDAIDTAYYSKVVCTLDNGVYYYTLNDRLLLKVINQVDRRYILEKISEYRHGKYVFPEWVPLSEKRGRKLSKIGI